VVSHCVVVVAEDQLTAASATLFNALSFPCLANETLDSLCALTGVAFEYATSGAASGAYGYSGSGGRPAGGAGSRQWCPTCSHAGLGAPTGRAPSTLASRSTFRPASGPTKLELTP